jgi:hypothetical protein
MVDRETEEIWEAAKSAVLAPGQGAAGCASFSYPPPPRVSGYMWSNYTANRTTGLLPSITAHLRGGNSTPELDRFVIEAGIRRKLVARFKEASIESSVRFWRRQEEAEGGRLVRDDPMDID